jgi:hypothetical protein
MIGIDKKNYEIDFFKRSGLFLETRFFGGGITHNAELSGEHTEFTFESLNHPLRATSGLSDLSYLFFKLKGFAALIIADLKPLIYTINKQF